MTDVQKIVLIGAAVLVGLVLLVSLTLSHTIGGFLRTVEREEAEAREREAAEDASKRPDQTQLPGA